MKLKDIIFIACENFERLNPNDREKYVEGVVKKIKQELMKKINRTLEEVKND